MAIKNDAEKKKMIVLGVLVAVICGVGAFQFVSGSSEPAPTAKKEEKKESAPSGPIKNDIDTAKNVAASGNSATASANGAMPPGGPNGEVTDVTSSVAANFPGDSPLRKLYAYKLPTRDPFADTTNVPKTDAVQQPSQPTQPTSKPPRTGSRPPMSELGPLDPSQFQLPGANGGISVTPGVGLPVADAFNYRVTGVIEGARPAAVFSDDQGNQRLIAAGDSIDGDSKVLSVSKGKVVVSHKGKKITLTMGGQPDAK